MDRTIHVWSAVAVVDQSPRLLHHDAIAGSAAIWLIVLLAAFILSLVSAWLRHRRGGLSTLLEARPLPRLDDHDLSETRYCPLCRAEYLFITPACDDCGVDLVDESALPQLEDEQVDERLVCIMHIATLRGYMLRSFLACSDIPSALIRSNFWGDVAGGGLYVFESDALRARRILNDCLNAAEADVLIA